MRMADDIYLCHPFLCDNINNFFEFDLKSPMNS